MFPYPNTEEKLLFELNRLDLKKKTDDKDV